MGYGLLLSLALAQQVSHCRRQRGPGQVLTEGRASGRDLQVIKEEALPAAQGDLSPQCSPLLPRALLLGLLAA